MCLTAVLELVGADIDASLSADAPPLSLRIATPTSTPSAETASGAVTYRLRCIGGSGIGARACVRAIVEL